MDIRSSPIFTREFTDSSDFTLDEGDVLLHGSSEEERCSFLRRHAGRRQTYRLQSTNEFELGFESIDNAGSIALRSTSQLNNFVGSFTGRRIYIDVTSLELRQWMPLLNAALDVEHSDLHVLYAAPKSYHFSDSPTEGELFDLSTPAKSTSPIPGLATLTIPEEKDSVFVPMLGFEGTRFSYLVEMVQPPSNRVRPIIGVPGFGVDYPFYSYLGNKLPLVSTRAWANVIFAPAECPFRAFYLLEDILERNHFAMKLAPIGTKPHAVAAALLRKLYPRAVELVFDHREHKASGTSGLSKILDFRVSPLYTHRCQRLSTSTSLQTA